jgi:hypothetical protein
VEVLEGEAIEADGVGVSTNISIAPCGSDHLLL